MDNQVPRPIACTAAASITPLLCAAIDATPHTADTPFSCVAHVHFIHVGFVGSAQVAELNAQAVALGKPWATQLHSADAQNEGAARRGDYQLVFIRLSEPPRHASSRLCLAGTPRGGYFWWRWMRRCISESNDQYRKEFRELGGLRQCVPGVPFIALTATAAPHVREDILDVLQLSNPLMAVESIYRPHLFLARELKPSTKERVCRRVLELLKVHRTPAIVYVTKPKEAESLLLDLRRRLANAPIVLETYHGPGRSGRVKQSDAERTRVLAAFLAEKVDVIVATCAFGLGINKRGIRQVIHVGPPHNFLDGYVQEIGRGGRGGVPARCTLLASSGDIAALDRGRRRRAAASRIPELQPPADLMRDFIFGDGCRWAFLRKAFGEEAPWVGADGCERRWEWKQSGADGERRCHHCDNCCSAADLDGGGASEIVECSSLVRLLLSALREAQHDEAAGGAASWSAIHQKLEAAGSRLHDLRAAVPVHLLACGPRSGSRAAFQLKTWLAEVLATRTELVERSTEGSEREGNRPHDGFRLTSAGEARLRLLETEPEAATSAATSAVGGAASPSRLFSLSLPKSLLRSLCGPAERGRPNGQ